MKWATRAGIHIDRAASAWLIQRFIDPDAVFEFVTDPAVPPIPPHATWEQIKSTAQSFLKGDADRWGMVKEGARSKVAEILPGGTDDPAP